VFAFLQDELSGSASCRSASLHNGCRYPFDRGLRRSQRNQHYPDDCEHNHSREFSALDHIPVFLRSHNPACARFAYPPKAIRLRFAPGSRTASSKKIPSVT
jgi:hypothetical protein